MSEGSPRIGTRSGRISSRSIVKSTKKIPPSRLPINFSSHLPYTRAAPRSPLPTRTLPFPSITASSVPFSPGISTRTHRAFDTGVAWEQLSSSKASHDIRSFVAGVVVVVVEFLLVFGSRGLAFVKVVAELRRRGQGGPAEMSFDTAEMSFDAANVDPSVLAELPSDIREAIEKDMAKVKPLPKKRKYHQAKETKDEVEVLCFKCRREPGKARQATLSFLKQPPETTTDVCARCRMPLQSKKKKTPQQSSRTTQLPQVTRLKGYKRLAGDTGVPFALSDGEAMALMRQNCVGCGAPAGDDGNGISRLRNWDGFDKARAKKPFMGPFSKINCVPACATCNLMKGPRRIPSFVEACRTIATHRGLGAFGSYPNRFRDNTSKRSRSSYITLSSTHTKTHSLTNQQFNAIVAMPCAYCGKEPSDTHHNGLDRIDSDDRVYRVDNVVSCCGDCNIMKYKHSLDFFLAHCLAVSLHHLDTVFPDDSSPDPDDDVRDDDDDAVVGEYSHEDEALVSSSEDRSS